MENIVENFLKVSLESNSGSGDGSGYGYGYGDGSGSGSDDGYGSGSDDGYGYGHGYGDGDGYGYGYGDGYGYGSGSGSGDGYGYDYGSDGYIRTFNNNQVYIIDNTKTIIESIHNNIAKGYIIKKDLTLEDCFIAKISNYFAHGKTAKEAVAAARSKYNISKPLEERLAEFNKAFPDRDKKIPAKELYKWHNILTGSCEFGRREFCKDHEIDIDTDLLTVNEFIALTVNEYGGDIITQL